MLAISLTTLVGVGGIAVDVGNWYFTAQRLQRASDAAALAAAPYLPGNRIEAERAALDELTRNGINVGHRTNGPTQDALHSHDRFEHHVRVHPDPVYPNRMRVEVGVSLRSILVGLIGHQEQVIIRSSTAKYTANVPMGSPGQALGAEPGADKVTPVGQQTRNGKYWLNISGEGTDKVTGDRYSTDKCGNTDDCRNGNNTVYPYGSDNGRSHRFIVHVPPGQGTPSNPVEVQVFDGAYVDVGDHCDNTALLNGAVQALDPGGRYAPNAGQWCTGDTRQSGSNGSTSPALKLTTHAPTSSRSNLGTQLSSTTFPTVKANGNLAASISNSTGNGPNVRNTFRQWYTFATLTQGPGDYVIQATTPDGSIGANRFSLRAGSSKPGTSVGSVKGLSIAADGHITLYTNATANDTSFYFAKLTSGSAGRLLDINLYDIGDLPNNTPVTLQLVMPEGAPGNMQFQGCTQTGPGTLVQVRSNCTIPNATSATYNGKNVKLSVKVPDNYVCNDLGGDECWMSLRFQVAPGTDMVQSTDTTTWEVIECGRPLRLVGPNEPEKSCKD